MCTYDPAAVADLQRQRVPVWSGNHPRNRLSRIGNRQHNAAIHRIAITQAHYHPRARAFLERRRATGDTKAESLRALKRRLCDVVHQARLTDARQPSPVTLPLGAAA